MSEEKTEVDANIFGKSWDSDNYVWGDLQRLVDYTHNDMEIPCIQLRIVDEINVDNAADDYTDINNAVGILQIPTNRKAGLIKVMRELLEVLEAEQ